ncbi:MAG: GNAT family N-acetyltransferase [Chloroflexi bacterium]|nr:GNAT family N-acetyltransferase [Chloroflexota bacterium]
MPKVDYRLATEADFSAVADMYAKLDALMHRMGMHLPEPENVGQAWVDSFRRTLGRYSFLHVVEVDGKLVGFLLSRLKRVPPYWGGVIVGEIADLWVDIRARKLNLAKNLLRDAVELLSDQNIHSIEASILFKNEPAQTLGESIGFKTEVHTARLLWENYVEEEDE